MVGVALAFFYTEHGGSKHTQPIPLSETTIKYGRMVAYFMLVFNAFGTYSSRTAGIHFYACTWSEVWDHLYFVCSDLLWSLAIGFLMLLGLFNRGGVFTRFLASAVFTPLGRLVYTAYLVHFVFLFTLYAGANVKSDWFGI